MADDKRNQNQSGMTGKESNQKMNQGQQQEGNFDNPQEGRAWDNYQTRTLSSNSSEGGMSGKENVDLSEDQSSADSSDQ